MPTAPREFAELDSPKVDGTPKSSITTGPSSWGASQPSAKRVELLWPKDGSCSPMPNVWKSQVERDAFVESNCARCFQPDEAMKRITGDGPGCPHLARAEQNKLPTPWTRRRNAVMGETYRCADFAPKAAVNRRGKCRRRDATDVGGSVGGSTPRARRRMAGLSSRTTEDERGRPPVSDSDINAGIRIGIDWVANVAEMLANERNGAAQDVLFALSKTLRTEISDIQIDLIRHNQP
jgi:hypothetical protein